MSREQVLDLLLSQGEEFLSGQEMSRRLGISRAAVWKAVQALQEEGFQVESRTNRGYRIVAKPDTLSESGVRAQLPPGDSRQLLVLQEVDSTNLEAKRLALAGAPHRTAVLALRQTAGRGRLERSFFSPPGSLYLSLLLRPQRPPQDLMVLTAFTAVAVRRAILSVTGLSVEIKWTNDLVLQGKKLCGIGTELSLEGETGRVQYAVVGIGVNTNVEEFPPELRDTATSLYLASHRRWSLPKLAALVLQEMDALLEDGLGQGRAAWLKEYGENCLTLHRDVLLVRGKEQRRGHALGLTEDAGLLVRFEDGREEEVSSGEVSVRGLYGYVDP